MPHTLAIVAMVFAYMWVADPLVNVRGPWVALPVVLILAVSVRHNMKTRAWGFSRRAFWPALGWSTVLTVTLGAALWFIGHAQGAPPVRPAPLLDFLYVVVWGGAQQFVLQTVILRESQHAVRRGATILAAAIFASVHVPNPFLTIVTFVGALAWCGIYARHPNIVPLALSHATATVIILMSFNRDLTGGLRTGWRYLQP
jgi:membrane protease YdiL (CAAX protease family)